MNTEQFEWINPPQKFKLDNDVLRIHTEPETDFWKRTHYGFSKMNAPAFLKKIEGAFIFSVKTCFKTKNQYDQCGVLLYVDDENWVKVSVEHENEEFARQGSVVTNLGFSDWATTDVSSSVNEMWYKLSFKNQDCLIENSSTGKDYKQMRILHIHKPVMEVKIGVYACSPLNSSFEAAFSEFFLGPYY